MDNSSAQATPQADNTPAAAPKPVDPEKAQATLYNGDAAEKPQGPQEKPETKEPIKQDEPKQEPSPNETPDVKADPENKVPEKYELKLPERTFLTNEHIEKISSFAKERGLSNEEAQAVLERDNEVVTTVLDRFKKDSEARSQQWVETLKSDKDFGGDRFKETVNLAHKVIQEFGSEELQKELDVTGYGNHPELVKFCHRIGKSLAPDRFVKTSAVQQPKPKTIEDTLYPTMSKQKEQ